MHFPRTFLAQLPIAFGFLILGTLALVVLSAPRDETARMLLASNLDGVFAALAAE